MTRLRKMMLEDRVAIIRKIPYVATFVLFVHFPVWTLTIRYSSIPESSDWLSDGFRIQLSPNS